MDVEEDDPTRWLGDTPVLNLSDDKLRLRVQTVTQFSYSEAEKLRSICRYVASIPFQVRALSTMKSSRVSLAQRKPAGWFTKAALFQAMLRTAGFPARIRMICVDANMYRGLVGGNAGTFVLPVVEVWSGGRWVVTDSYLYDPRYLAAAREAVQQRGWRSGFGVHLDGQTDWDGINDALVMIVPDHSQGVRPAQFRAVYDDPLGFDRELRRKSGLRYLLLLAHNRIMTMRIARQVRRLREEAGG
jgi:hypothetical protein